MSSVSVVIGTLRVKSQFSLKSPNVASLEISSESLSFQLDWDHCRLCSEEHCEFGFTKFTQVCLYVSVDSIFICMYKFWPIFNYSEVFRSTIMHTIR